MMVTAFRLGEIVRHTSGEIMFLTFESLSWSLGGALVKHPTKSQLRAMRSGIDGARLAPPRSKPDQWGEIHCPFAAVLTYEEHDPINAAAALRDIELQCQPPEAERPSTPLFSDANGAPYTHHYLHHILRLVLTYLYGKSVASLYSWHSFRSGLATALHAAGVDDGMIQLICRWMCPESLHIYRRMGVAENEQLVKRAATANVDLIQAVNIPRVFADQGLARLVEEFAGPRSADCQRAYEHALKMALDPFQKEAPHGDPPQGDNGLLHTAAADTDRPGGPLTHPLRAGDRVAVPSQLWPRNPCLEMGGAAWHATIVKATATTAVISFDRARTKAGRPYENTSIQISTLRSVTQPDEADAPQ